MAGYISVGLTPQARDALRDMTLELTTPVGRRMTMSEVLIASLELAGRHRGELIEALKDETPSAP